MIIRMKGEPRELAEFAKAMQLPVMGFGEPEVTTEAEAEVEEVDQAEVEKEVERLFRVDEEVQKKTEQIIAEKRRNVILSTSVHPDEVRKIAMAANWSGESIAHFVREAVMERVKYSGVK